MGTVELTDGRARTDALTLPPRAHGDSPPVVILNMFYSGLGIARAMAGKGVHVIGLSADPKIYGNFTRWCEVRSAPNSQERPEELAGFLLRHVNDFPGAIIFPTRDADVIFLDRFRSELEEFYRLCIPPANRLRTAIDKYELTRAARVAQVPTPRTILIDTSADLRFVSGRVGFPCVLKPVCAFQWRAGDAWGRVGARKAVRVDNEEVLREEYRQISSVTPQVLVQEWISGGTENIVVLGGYADENSELLSYFTARKLLQSPDDCGTGCIVQSEPIPEIVEPTRRLLSSLRYRGMAEVEYKFDSATGEYKLIEINTRHWDQHQLGQASGINLTWVAYCDLAGRPAPRSPRPVIRAKWIAEDALFLYLLRALYHRQVRLRDLWRKVAGRRMYGMFAWSDPFPSLRYWLVVLLPDLAASVYGKVTGRQDSEGQSS